VTRGRLQKRVAEWGAEDKRTRTELLNTLKDKGFKLDLVRRDQTWKNAQNEKGGKEKRKKKKSGGKGMGKVSENSHDRPEEKSVKQKSNRSQRRSWGKIARGPHSDRGCDHG